MFLPKLDKIICGCSLESGSKVIGYFLLTVRAAAIIIAIVSYSYETNFIEEDPKYEGVHEVILLSTVIEVVVLLIFCIFDVLMLIGVYTKRSSFVLPWIAIQVGAICLGMVSFMKLITGGATVLQITQTILGVVMFMYFILIVNSHYQDLKSEEAKSFPNK